jgi:putative lipoprotein
MPIDSRSRPNKGTWLWVVIAVNLAFPVPAHANDRDPWLARDKALYFGASSIIACGGYGTTAVLSDSTGVRLAGGAGVALSAGIAKEVYDKYSGGDASFRDLTWDAVGTATGLVLSWLIDRYLL